MFIGSIILALALNASAYANGISLVLTVIVLGVAAATVPPLVMAVTADSLPPSLAGTGFNIVTMCQNAGITLSGPLIGFVILITGKIYAAFFGISLFALAAAVTALSLRSK